MTGVAVTALIITPVLQSQCCAGKDTIGTSDRLIEGSSCYTPSIGADEQVQLQSEVTQQPAVRSEVEGASRMRAIRS